MPSDAHIRPSAPSTAAATVVIMETTSAAPEDKPRPIEVRIDRPFLFAIRDTETGTILFLGRVTDPRG